MIAVGLLAYLTTALVVALVVWRNLPSSYQLGGAKGFALLLSLNLFLPVLGMLFTGIILLFSLYFPEDQKAVNTRQFEVPDLPHTPQEEVAPLYSHGGLRAVLKHADSSDKRQAAVLSTRQMKDKDAIPILRLVLNDLEDDVRLLAYSLLDQKESRINANIYYLNLLLGQKTGVDRKARILRKLAECYWELGYLGITEGELKRFVLAESVRYGEEAISIADNLATRLLLGRAYLALDDPGAAREHLLFAFDSNSAKQQVLPYLAEAAFKQKRYNEVKQYLKDIPQVQQNLALRAVKEYWS